MTSSTATPLSDDRGETDHRRVAVRFRGSDVVRLLGTGVLTFLSPRWLDTGSEGTDPLAAFGAHAPAMLATATLMPNAPDLYVNSSFDPVTMDVAAFEPLVGCHGGLGGWQDRAFVMAPTHLVAMLVALGRRTELQRISS